MMAALLLVVLLFPQPKLGAAAARGCPHNVALQGGLAGTSMVLDRGGSRLFGVTPFPNDTITVTLNSQPAVHMTVTAGRRLPTKPQAPPQWFWQAMLPSLPYGGSLNLSVSSAKGVAAGCSPNVVTDVTVGQVYLCSGRE